MKTLFTLIIVLLTLTACQRNQSKTENCSPKTELVDLTIDGKTHEFVLYSRSRLSNGLAHWPECSYCKEHDRQLQQY